MSSPLHECTLNNASNALSLRPTDKFLSFSPTTSERARMRWMDFVRWKRAIALLVKCDCLYSEVDGVSFTFISPSTTFQAFFFACSQRNDLSGEKSWAERSHHHPRKFHTGQFTSWKSNSSRWEQFPRTSTSFFIFLFAFLHFAILTSEFCFVFAVCSSRLSLCFDFTPMMGAVLGAAMM